MTFASIHRLVLAAAVAVACLAVTGTARAQQPTPAALALAKELVVLKGGAPRTSGTVDVAFYLAGVKTAASGTITAANATTDATMRRMVSSRSESFSRETTPGPFGTLASPSAASSQRQSVAPARSALQATALSLPKASSCS